MNRKRESIPPYNMLLFLLIVALSILASCLSLNIYFRLIEQAHEKTSHLIVYYCLLIVFGILFELVLIMLAINQIHPEYDLRKKIHVRSLPLFLALLAWAVSFFAYAWRLLKRFRKRSLTNNREV
jgi:glucan phosphoethanolaminetransferase (alkaline phosphatase superfamily)